MTDAQLQRLLETAAEEGAKRALARVGLHDDTAGEDVRDLRDILNAFRSAKRSMMDTFVRAVTMIIIGAMTAAASIHFWRSGQ